MTPRQWHDRAVNRSSLVTTGTLAFVGGGIMRTWWLLALAVVCAVVFLLTAPPKDEP